MMRMIKESHDRQNHEFTSSIFSGEKPPLFNEQLSSQSRDEQLDPKDIYMRVASNCELIQLYAEVNQQLIDRAP